MATTDLTLTPTPTNPRNPNPKNPYSPNPIKFTTLNPWRLFWGVHIQFWNFTLPFKCSSPPIWGSAHPILGVPPLIGGDTTNFGGDTTNFGGDTTDFRVPHPPFLGSPLILKVLAPNFGGPHNFDVSSPKLGLRPFNFGGGSPLSLAFHPNIGP